MLTTFLNIQTTFAANFLLILERIHKLFGMCVHMEQMKI